MHTALDRLRWMPGEDVFEAGNSYIGLARQASHSHQEKVALARVLLWRGHAIGGRDFTKALRRNQ